MTNDLPPTFLFAGGGSGGHLFPGIAVAEELRRVLPTSRILFAGSNRDVERGIISTAGFDHVSLSSPPSTLLKRRPLRFLLEYRRACRSAASIVGEIQPAAVVGLGGFASVPLVTAAKKRRVPIVLLEQNAVAGRATSRLSKLANVVCHSFTTAVPNGRRGNNCVVTGNPLRCEIAKLVTAGAHPRHSGHPQLLVLGGSQGSTAVNLAMSFAAGELRNELRGWRIVHQCGPNDQPALRERYAALKFEGEVEPFFDDLPARYADANLVVSRAGATTLAELAGFGLPAVLVPYRNAVRNHQNRNAHVFASAGAAVIVRQERDESITGGQLANSLRTLLSDSGRRLQMSAAMQSLAKPNATSQIAEIVLKIAGSSAKVRCEEPPRPPHFAAWNSHKTQDAAAKGGQKR